MSLKRFIGASLVPAMIALGALASAACRGDSEAAAHVAAAPGASPVVATVNGTRITEADLALAMATAARAANPHEGGGPPVAPPVRAEVLERLIDDELAAQQARASHLDADPTYQQELAGQEAQLDSFRRQRLASLAQHDAREHADVTDVAARTFFAEHAAEIRTVTRVQQILLHDRTATEQARRDLERGIAFDEVAARQFPALPAGTRPWELGELGWNQIPEPWRAVLPGLAVGAISPIIAGPRGRLWIIKVVDRKIDPTVAFESAKGTILTVLRGRAGEAAQTELTRKLRAGATISRSPTAGGARVP